MDLDLSGRRALITGASQGIGLATARLLAQEGADVGLVARDPARLQQVAAALRDETGVSVVPLPCDVTVTADIDRAVRSFEQAVGGVDILVNNAGGISAFGDFDALSDEDWAESFGWNLMAPVRFVRAVLPGMRERDWGRIVNVSSESAVQPDAFFPHYAAMKSALMTLTKALSRSFAGTGIRTNVVSPAFVKTPILERMLEDYAAGRGVSVEEGERLFLAEERPHITARRAGRPEEVAAVIGLLCSPISDFVNGSNFRVDSGSVSTI